ncbi:hypothetical protein CANCADRAFT_94516 [Tortispora caseinolytica NRRL Y-17796]|uniref:Mso1 N-terminal domain-containing protein n=1 Tax=Tortispora caseinolytica NRRL Y-17796 TaxID=767744 RepID=A0A1E4TM89_9ASCO|nr:hypothetical protein CANCADRAFT_94516 [Tortispora caseinolytica NRRL Y-17796]
MERYRPSVPTYGLKRAESVDPNFHSSVHRVNSADKTSESKGFGSGFVSRLRHYKSSASQKLKSEQDGPTEDTTLVHLALLNFYGDRPPEWLVPEQQSASERPEFKPTYSSQYQPSQHQQQQQPPQPTSQFSNFSPKYQQPRVSTPQANIYAQRSQSVAQQGSAPPNIYAQRSMSVATGTGAMQPSTSRGSGSNRQMDANQYAVDRRGTFDATATYDSVRNQTPSPALSQSSSGSQRIRDRFKAPRDRVTQF